MQITVVGAGVVGLTTALVLEERGHQVRVVATATGEATTSAVAAAMWFPYRAGPPHKVIAWGARTRAWLEELARDRSAGVDLIVDYEITTDEARPWWAAGIASRDSLPASSAAEGRCGSMTVERVPAPVTGAPLAWRFATPRIEPALFLPWLAGRLRAPLERRAVVELAAEDGDVVVNCAGLAARELAGDAELVALLGQTVICAPGAVDRAISITDERDPDAMFYLIPRRDELVLGGCSLPWPPRTPPEIASRDSLPASSAAEGRRGMIDPAIRARILAHAAALGLPIGEVRGDRVGLRPYRPEVRLERDPLHPNVIHHYGHGGAGYTLCRGCAEDVARLVSESAAGESRSDAPGARPTSEPETRSTR